MQKLHLGCGRIKKEGYINCDISEAVNPDKVVDLEAKLHFENDSIEEIIIEHCLEHIKNLFPLMKEFYRICKNKAIIKIKVPYFSSESAFSTMTHIRFFSLTSFDFFDEKHKNYYDAPKINMRVIKKSLHWRRIFYPLEFLLNLNYITLRIYQELFCWIIPARELEIWLEVRK